MSTLSLAAQRVAAAWIGLPPVAAGAVWMLICAIAYSLMAVFIRLAVTTLPGGEVTFFRNLGALVFLAPLFVRHGIRVLRVARPWAASTLALWQAISNLCWVLAVVVIPLADGMAIMFLTPILVVALAALLRIEKVGWSRWAATLVGFAGMLLIVRPGFQAVPVEALLVLASAVVTAFFSLSVRNLGRDHHPDTLVLIALAGSLPLLAVIAAPTWRLPEPQEAVFLGAIGLAAAVGQVAMTRAYAVAESSSVMPFMFLQLPLTAVAAYLAFGQVPDLVTCLGAAVILASAHFTMRREARR